MESGEQRAEREQREQKPESREWRAERERASERERESRAEQREKEGLLSEPNHMFCCILRIVQTLCLQSICVH